MVTPIWWEVWRYVNAHCGSGFGRCGGDVELMTFVGCVHIQLAWHTLLDPLGYSRFHGGEVVPVPKGEKDSFRCQMGS